MTPRFVPDAVPAVVLHHLGELHPYETVLVLLLAFGPFVVIVLLVLRERRKQAAQDARVAHDETERHAGNGATG